MNELLDLPEPSDRDSLAAHGVRPFSVLRADRGPWQTRKRGWNDLGIDSRRGREHVSTYKLSGTWSQQVLTSINGGLSTFDPVLAETCYTWYCPPGGRVIDPFAGGSVRGLVAGNLGYDYTGVDLSPEQLDANRDQGDDWATRDLLAAPVRWIYGDAVEVLPTLPAGEFDYALTCPPYHTLEHYTRDPRDLSRMRWKRFTRVYREIVAATVERLADDRFMTWVVGEVRDGAGMLRGLVPLTIEAHEQVGARFYNDAVVLNVIGTAAARLPGQWRATRKFGCHHQYALTFVKGDPRAATRVIAGAGQ